MRNIFIASVILILLAPLAALAARTATRLSGAPAQSAAVTADTTPPVIIITSPQVKRDVKLTAKEASLTIVGKATDANGVASVTVNGHPAALDENGNFSAELLLKPGDNLITVTAVDVYKNTANERFTVSRETMHVAKSKEEAPAIPAVTGKSNAPVIIITSPQVKRGVKLVAKETNLTIIGKATDESGVASVTVNGRTADLDEDGNFSAELLLRPGDNLITVTAVDVYKNTAEERFTIRREAGQVARAKKETPAVPVVVGKSYALVIGINQYQNIDRLRTATADAQEVAQVLREYYGFETRLILDGKATRTAIMKEMNDLKNRLNSEDRLLIYYAGHGYNDTETGTSYWLPVEAEKDDPTNWIEARSITDQLKRTRAKQVLIVADSCYSGTMARAVDPSLSGRGTRESYLQKLMDKPSRVLIASGGNEPVNDTGGKGHSIFAQVFIDALRSPPESVFTAEELLTRQIKESVAGRVDQTPEYKIIRNSGHDGGDFVFVKR